MTVKDLKNLLKYIPVGMTKKEFNSLPILVYGGDGVFNTPLIDDSGYVEFGEACDEHGEPIETLDDEDTIKAFAIFTDVHNLEDL